MSILKCSSVRALALAAAALLAGSATPLFSQAPAQQQPNAPETNNPLRPEIQPDLKVDRDPIPSPDIETPPAAAATTPSKPGQLTREKSGVYTMNVNVDEVLLNCAVIDERGRPVLDLRRQNFRVWEDGVPQTVSSFVHQDQPVSMGILVDNSGSMRDKRAAVDNAAMKLLQQSNPQDAAFVVNFNDHAFLDQGFTTDRVALRQGLAHFDSRGTTALYDAVVASADELSRHARHAKQILLIVTDGADNASHLALRDAIRRVQTLGGPVIYTIGLLYDDEPQEAQKAHDDLEALSAETGGIAYFPSSLDDVDRIASEVATDIRNQYVVGYHSTRPASDGGYRTVQVEAYMGKHKLTVRTRRGYYAHPGQRNDMTARRVNPAGPNAVPPTSAAPPENSAAPPTSAAPPQ